MNDRLVLLLVALSAPLPAVTHDVRVTGPNQYAVALSVPVQAPLETCWRILTDFQSHAKRLPHLERSQILETRPDAQIVEQEGKIRVLFWTFRIRVKQVVTVASPQIDFHAIDGDFKSLRGTWRLSPSSTDPTQLVLSGQWAMEPKRRVPAWAVRFAVKRYLAAMVQALGRWMEKESLGA